MNPKTTEKTTEAAIASASPTCPSANMTAVAAIRTRITPPLSWFQNMRQGPRASAPGESSAGLSGRASGDRPVSRFVRSSRATSSTRRAWQAWASGEVGDGVMSVPLIVTGSPRGAGRGQATPRRATTISHALYAASRGGKTVLLVEILARERASSTV